MSTENPRADLLPDPAAVVVLVKNLVEGPWPRTEADRVELFQRLKLVSKGAVEQPAGGPTTLFRMETALHGGVFGSWDSYRERFMGVCVHVYNAPTPRNPDTRRGYDEVRFLLTTLYGEPTEPWHGEKTPPCIWTVNGRRVTIHFFDARDSSVMVSIEDGILADLAEAESGDHVRPDD
ncbi:hypothetical protein [Specibacter cremeus]|uniref:hypothetical protein n=1 Tax=Specibacter cremeus TaxID=1629051 RepID=UPI000F78F9EC|nr:hypothetical protein [Specibacter cremeus]